MADELLAQTVKKLSDEVAELRRQTDDNDQRLAGGMATMVVLTKEQARQVVRHVEFVSDAVRKELLQVRGAVNTLGNRPPSLTTVQDVPHDEGREPTGITYIGRDGIKRFKIPGVPTKYLLHLAIIIAALLVVLGVVLGRHGVNAGDVVKVASPLVAP